MITLSNTLSLFIYAVKRNKVSLTGACLVSIVFPILIVCAILDFLDVFHTPLFGAFVYGVLTPLFIIGHLFFFYGFFFIKSTDSELTPCSYGFLKEKFQGVTEKTSFRNLLLFSTILGIANFVILVLVGYTGHHYSETPRFCGTLCHSVMLPEHGAHKISPHSRVPCVDCHVGSGLKNFVSSKISGMRQVVGVITDDYARPITMPAHGLRPAKQTCEECHRPELFLGDKINIKNMYAEDEANTLLQTVLMMKVGSGGRGKAAKGIHWHVSTDNKITFTYSDNEKEIISEVQLTRADGTIVVYKDSELEETEKKTGHGGGIKEMDCVDCHNRPSHIYFSPEEAIDRSISDGLISRELPFIKKKGVELITAEYSSKEEAIKNIKMNLTAWYKEKYPQIASEKSAHILQAAKAMQESYRQNIYPDMKITWNTYKSNLGHKDDAGCFRCHNDSFEAENGRVISQDCANCHVLIAEEEENPQIVQDLLGGE